MAPATRGRAGSAGGTGPAGNSETRAVDRGAAEGGARGACIAHSTLPGMTEASIGGLIAAARGGDNHALGELLGAVRKYLVVIAARRLPADIGPDLAPSDIAQETALDVQRAFGGFNGSTGPELLAWVRAILVHNVSDAVRKSRADDRVVAAVGRHPSSPDPGADGERRSPTAPARPTEASAIRRDEARLVDRVLATLPADAREVMRLRYWEGMTFPAIGKRLGRSENAIRKRWYRAITCLQEEIRRSRPRPDAAERARS